MMAAHSGNIKLVAECLNNNLNPFLKDGFDRTAIDYVQSGADNKGNSIKKIISEACE